MSQSQIWCTFVQAPELKIGMQACCVKSNSGGYTWTDCVISNKTDSCQWQSGDCHDSPFVAVYHSHKLLNFRVTRRISQPLPTHYPKMIYIMASMQELLPSNDWIIVCVWTKWFCSMAIKILFLGTQHVLTKYYIESTNHGDRPLWDHDDCYLNNNPFQTTLVH